MLCIAAHLPLHKCSVHLHLQSVSLNRVSLKNESNVFQVVFGKLIIKWAAPHLLGLSVSATGAECLCLSRMFFLGLSVSCILANMDSECDRVYLHVIEMSLVIICLRIRIGAFFCFWKFGLNSVIGCPKWSDARYPRPEMGLWAHLRASDPFWGRKRPFGGSFRMSSPDMLM